MRQQLRRTAWLLVVSLALTLPTAAAAPRATARARWLAAPVTGAPAPRLAGSLQRRPARVEAGHRRSSGSSVSSDETPSHQPLTATVVSSFDALEIGDAGASARPPDPTGAVGPGFFMAAVNVAVSVYDRAGVEVLGPMRLQSLFSSLPPNDTDPKLVYDPYDDAFVLVYLVYSSTKNDIVVVYIPGSTADDFSTWCGLIVPGDQVSGDGKQFADYPSVGLTADRVAITTNNFDFDSGLPPGKYDYAQIISIKKSELYDPTCTIVPTLRVFSGNQLRDPDGSKAFTLQAAATVGGTEPTTQFLTSFDFNGPAVKSNLVLWRLKKQDGKLKLTKVALSVGKVDYPPYGRQCDAGTADEWDTGDLRLVNASYDAGAGTLQTAHAVAHQFGGGGMESGVRWYEIDPASPLSDSTVARKGFVGADGVDTGWPSVVTDSDGVVFVDYSRAGGSECLGIWAASILPGGSAASQLEVRAGDARYNFAAGVDRWGDFSAIGRDPLDPTQVALFNAYALTDGAGSTSLWREHVALVDDV